MKTDILFTFFGEAYTLADCTVPLLVLALMIVGFAAIVMGQRLLDLSETVAKQDAELFRLKFQLNDYKRADQLRRASGISQVRDFMCEEDSRMYATDLHNSY